MTPIVLRPVLSLADVEYNLGLLAQALANISGDQIVPGTIPSGALSGDYMPRSGGAFSGAVEVPSLTVGGTAVQLTGISYAIAETDALLAAKAGTATTYTKVEVDALVSGAAPAGTTYTKAQIDTLLAAKAGTAIGTPTTAGLMRQANAVTLIGFTPAAAYSQSEAQTVVTTVNGVINALKNAGLMT